MAERKFDKYIVYEAPPNPFHATGSFSGTELFAVNNETFKQARLNCVWFTGPWTIDEVYKPHAHSCSEEIFFIGSDPSNPHELGGEIEFWFEEERYLITKSCVIYIPEMLQHSPMWPKRVDRPILFINIVNKTTREEEVTYYSRNPKWKDFKDPPATSTRKIAWMD